MEVPDSDNSSEDDLSDEFFDDLVASTPYRRDRGNQRGVEHAQPAEEVEVEVTPAEPNPEHELPDVIVFNLPSPATRRGRKRKHNEELSVPNQPTTSRAARGLVCSICLGPPRQTSATKCGHIYCKECILTALNETQKCPICQVITDSKAIIRLHI